MTATYPLHFHDARGSETAVLRKDGTLLDVALRGIRFSGADFDALSPVPADLARARDLFTLCGDLLCACRLDWTMPITVDGPVPERTTLRAELTLGAPMASGRLAFETLLLELHTSSGVLRSEGRSGWFEDELLDLSRQLAPGESVRACFTCAFSDYHPAGHGLSGGLACFRDAKAAYGRVTGKAELFDVWDRMTGLVQETHLCDAYEPRRPGTGYRG